MPQADTQSHILAKHITLRNSATFENSLISFVFVLCSLTGFCGLLVESLKNSTTPIPQENRFPNPFPRLRNFRKDLPKFSLTFESFLNDRFPYRLDIVGKRNLALLKVFNSSGASNVAIGSNPDWLFFFFPSAKRAQINYQPFSQTGVELWGKGLQAKKDYLQSKGINYLCMFAPEKGTIYPEHLPKDLSRRPGESRLEALQDYLRSITDVTFVDIQAQMLNAKMYSDGKPEHKLYFFKDSHWTKYGATFAMQAIAKALNKPMPAFTVTSGASYESDLADYLKLGFELPESFPDVRIINPKARELPADRVPFASLYDTSHAFENADTRLPKIFMIHDSFTHYLRPFIAECSSFSQFYVGQDFKPALVLAQKPDIFIEEKAERMFYELEPPNIPDSVETLSKTTNPLATIGDAVGHPAIANYSDHFELVDVAARKTNDGLAFRMLWRGDKQQKLTGSVNFYTLQKDGTQAFVRYYSQDDLERNVAPGSQWLDTIEVPSSELVNCSQIGIAVVDGVDGCLTTQSAVSDNWSTRALVPISSCLANWDNLAKIYKTRQTVYLTR